MRPLLVPARRSIRQTEAIADQIIATGGALGAYGRDPVDGDVGYRRLGAGNREVPYWTQEKARTYSVTAYRSNPMATAIIDTYTAFCVGDSGVSWQATNPEVGDVVREFWDDPANRLGSIQELSLRSQLLLGEKLYELMVAPLSQVVRFAPIDPTHIKGIGCRSGNPLWPDMVTLLGTDDTGDDRKWSLVQVDDSTGLRDGQAMFWAPWRTLDTDVRGMPFLTSILDWLDSYDTVLSNLIDRTALARYMVWDVEVKGGQGEVDDFVAARGGLHVPPSGSVEVHNDSVTWKPQTVSTGAMEDTVANRSVLTNIASGTGLAKTWLAEPEGANRATSQTMAEPVRRRVGSVQKVWLAQQTELVRFVVDRAVAARRLPERVEATDPRTGASTTIPASQAVIVTGPEIAASDSQLTAQVLLNLSTGLEKLVAIGALSKDAAATAARKAWEDYVGVPYVHELDTPTANPDDLATAVAEAARVRERHRAGGGNRDYVRDHEGKFSQTSGGIGHPGSTTGGVAEKTDPPNVDPKSDPLKLASRIRLGPGETFTGSARVSDGNQDRVIVMAGLDTPTGARLRLGSVDPQDSRRWRAEDKGRTVDLDVEGARQLRDVVAGAATEGKKSVSDYRAALRAAHASHLPQSAWPDVEASISSGTIRGRFGQLHWSLDRQEGDNFLTLPGGEEWVGGEWRLSIDPAQGGTPAGQNDTFDLKSPAGAKNLLTALDGLIAGAA
ncbi:MAG: hypothetical protein JWO11_4422 [Nocardioides sp.]|nr:hypothetical protein [Nocardioides sp.]